MERTRARLIMGLLAAFLYAAVLAPLPARAQAGPPATSPGGLEIVSATWKVARQPDVDVTANLAAMVKDGQLELRVSAVNMHITPPAQGTVGSLVVSYRLDGGEPQTKTVRGGGTLLRLSAKAADTPDVVQADPPHVPMPPSAVMKLPMVQLTAQEPLDATNGSANGSLLIRELQRQAVWMAAGEQLGLRTRDMALEEPLTAEVPGRVTTLLLETQFRRAFATDITVALPGGAGATDLQSYAQVNVDKYLKAAPDKLLARVHKQLSARPWIDYALIVKNAESQSRHELVDGLKKSGALGTDLPHPPSWASGHVPVSDSIARELKTMNPVAQFVAVRLLHQQIRESGDSPELLAGLVQGYANLAFMTSPLYSGIYKTYMARSLLYAERLVVHSHSDAHSLYTRAYARGMAGFATLALDDIAAARKKQETGSPAPAWADIIETSCRYDLPAMQRAADTPGDFQPLSRMLAVGIAADGYSPQALATAGSASLSTQKENLWVMQQLFQASQNGSGDDMPERMLDAIPAMLKDTKATLMLPDDADRRRAGLKAGGPPGIAFTLIAPDVAQAHVDGGSPQFAEIADLRKSLGTYARTGEDAGEPSLAALAALVREEEFTAACMQVKAGRKDLGGAAAAATFARASAPAWRDHPLAGLVEAMTHDFTADHDAIVAALGKIKPDNGGAWFITDILNGFGDSSYDYTYHTQWAHWLVVEGHGDLIPMDFTLDALKSNRIDRDAYVQALRDQSPYATLPVLAWMANIPDDTRLNDQVATAKLIADVRAHHGDNDKVMLTAATWASDMHDYQTAIGILETLHQRAPSPATVDALERQYNLTGNMEKATALVNTTAKLTELGSYQEDMHSYLGLMLMRRGMYAQALEHLRAPAQSARDSILADVSSGMIMTCEDKLGESDKVESLLKQYVQRYPGGAARWYAWTRWHKRPEEAQAKEAALTYGKDHPNDFIANANMAMLDGHWSQAVELLKANSRRQTDTMALLSYAVVAAQAGDWAEVDSTLEKAAKINAYAEFKDAAVLMLAIRHGTDVAESLRKLEFEMGQPIMSQYTTITFLGQFLAATGHKPEATRFLRMALLQNGSTSVDYFLVLATLQKLGEDAAKIAKAQQTPIDLTPLLGTWKARQGGEPADWTFDTDHTVLSSSGMHGLWWESAGRILITWTPKQWAVIPWPLKPTGATGDCPAGPGQLSLTKIAR